MHSAAVNGFPTLLSYPSLQPSRSLSPSLWKISSPLYDGSLYGVSSLPRPKNLGILKPVNFSFTDINSVDVKSVAEKLKKSIVAQIGVVSLRAGASRAWRN